MGLSLAFGCAGDGEEPSGDMTPIAGGAAGATGAAGSMVTMGPITAAGVSGGNTTPVAGGGVAGVTNQGGASGATPMTNAGSSGATSAAGSSGMTGQAGADEAGSAGGAAGMMAAGAGAIAPTPMGAECDKAFACRGDAPTAMSSNGRQKGPYQVMSYTSGYMQGNFSDATMWYPSSAEAKPPFGCVAVVPGFLSPQSSIRNWGPFLASHGIVTITIGVPGGDQPAMRAESLMSALTTCIGENTREGSPIKGKLSPEHIGVSGWSMGGGGTLIAASRNPKLKAAVSFAAWGPTGGANNMVPSLMFEATADPLAAGMSDGFFRQTPETTPKMLFEVQGSSHSVANDPANHEGVIGLYGLSWWKVFMEGDLRYKQFLLAPKPSIATSKFATNVK